MTTGAGLSRRFVGDRKCDRELDRERDIALGYTGSRVDPEVKKGGQIFVAHNSWTYLSYHFTLYSTRYVIRRHGPSKKMIISIPNQLGRQIGRRLKLRILKLDTRRSFTSCHPLQHPSSSSSSSSKDPSHPNLYYHTVTEPPPGRIALSFLPDPPEQGSSTILGYLPLDGGAGLDDLQEEPRFM